MIRVFIGTEPKTEIARKVLQYSIKKFTSSKVEFFPMMGEDWILRPPSGIGTGFSLFRWDIPKRCDYKGFAIYLDADQLVLYDIKDLWESDIHYPNEKCSCWCTYRNPRTPETSVMLIDCEKAKFNQDPLDKILKILNTQSNRNTYIKVMHALNHQHIPQQIPESWNSLNKFERDKTKLLHFTIESKQPWFNPSHQYTPLWKQYLLEAIKANEVTQSEIENALSIYKKHEKGSRGTGMHPFWKIVLEDTPVG